MKCFGCRKKKADFYTVNANVILVSCVECSFQLNKAYPETEKNTYLTPEKKYDESKVGANRMACGKKDGGPYAS